MFKFFRNIRQTFLYRNRLGKYLVYALGEIVLVVIGILIALQINNWNEQRKRENLEIDFLNGLLLDLKQDTLYFSTKSNYYDQLANNQAEYLLRAYEIQPTYEDYLELVGLISWDSDNFIPQNVTYSELLNSGNLNIFQNKALKNNIIVHYKEYDKANKHITEFNTFSANFLSRLPFAHGNFYSSIKIPDEVLRDKRQWGYINDTESERFLFNIQSASLYGDKFKVFKDAYYDKLYIRASDLIGLIENELAHRVQ